MIQTFIHGDNGLDSKLRKSDIWRQLGGYAKRIESIAVGLTAAGSAAVFVLSRDLGEPNF
ncbi:hypothetical protein SAMN05518855_100536 [Paenibacillus sp. CF384]|nr:hypothetical protein SAMN05518855_100536 [Paenibacillus sp. CF384]